MADPKRARIEIRLTPGQKEAFQEVADREGITISELIRREILADERSTASTRKAVRNADIEIGNIGGDG